MINCTLSELNKQVNRESLWYTIEKDISNCITNEYCLPFPLGQVYTDIRVKVNCVDGIKQEVGDVAIQNRL